MSKKLRIIPLGGFGEVGKNMLAYEYNNQILVVDAGLMFPENDMVGVEYIIPDYEYLKQRSDKVVGFVITHGHEDHIGAIHHLLDHAGHAHAFENNGGPHLGTAAEQLGIAAAIVAIRRRRFPPR